MFTFVCIVQGGHRVQKALILNANVDLESSVRACYNGFWVNAKILQHTVLVSLWYEFFPALFVHHVWWRRSNINRWIPCRLLASFSIAFGSSTDHTTQRRTKNCWFHNFTSAPRVYTYCNAPSILPHQHHSLTMCFYTSMIQAIIFIAFLDNNKHISPRLSRMASWSFSLQHLWFK